MQRITIAAAAIVLLPTGASTGVSLTTRGDHGTCPASYPVVTTPAAAAARRLSEAAYQQTYALCERAVDPNNLAVEIDVLTIRYGAPTPAARAAATANLEGWAIPDMPSSTGATCEPCAAAGGGASTLTETSTSEENGFFSPPPAASPPPPVASPPPSPVPALPPFGGSNLTVTDDGEDMTLLWIIIGATVGVLAIAGAVVGGLAAAGSSGGDRARRRSRRWQNRRRSPRPSPKRRRRRIGGGGAGAGARTQARARAASPGSPRGFAGAGAGAAVPPAARVARGRELEL